MLKQAIDRGLIEEVSVPIEILQPPSEADRRSLSQVTEDLIDGAKEILANGGQPAPTFYGISGDGSIHFVDLSNLFGDSHGKHSAMAICREYTQKAQLHHAIFVCETVMATGEVSDSSFKEIMEKGTPVSKLPGARDSLMVLIESGTGERRCLSYAIHGERPNRVLDQTPAVFENPHGIIGNFFQHPKPNEKEEMPGFPKASPPPTTNRPPKLEPSPLDTLPGRTLH